MSQTHPNHQNHERRHKTDLPLFGASIEDNVVGTWFARLGVLALLIGAAFGYRYAVDQGLIGPAARVALGVFSGLGMIAGGHRARTSGWFNFSHALSGGGVAILYLSVLAAQYRFDLISPAVALTLLTGVALLSAWLAVRYDSLPLAVLTTIGAFLNPFFMAADDPVAALTYVVGVDLAVVGIAFFKRWPNLSKLALVGTVPLVVMAAEPAGSFLGVAFTTVLWTLFTAVPLVQVVRDVRTNRVADLGLIVSVGFLYLAAGIYFFEGSPMAQGVFALAAGGGYALWAAAAFSDERTRRAFTSLFGALAVGYTTLAAPLMLDGPTVQLMWAVEGALLLYVAGISGDLWARIASAGLIAAGLVGTVEAISTYEPDRLLLDPTSVVIALQIAVLYASAWLAGRSGLDDEWRPLVVQSLLVVANLLTLGWLSREVRFEVERSVPAGEAYAATQLALSALWGGYSAALVAAGVGFRQRWARYLGLATFGITVVKMVTVDLWQLEMLQRTIAFIGLGVLMIGCSFLYNRFRDLIVRPES